MLANESFALAGGAFGRPLRRQPLKKLPSDESELLKLLERWRAEAEKTGHKITRISVALEAGRDGFWLARWLRARTIEAHVIHAASVAVPQEHQRVKTDRASIPNNSNASFSAGSATSATAARCARSRRSSARFAGLAEYQRLHPVALRAPAHQFFRALFTIPRDPARCFSDPL